jgi:iron complex outermembrane receptor protein
MVRTTLAACIAGLFALPVQAEEIPSFDEIIVTATRIPTPDVDAPYASEIHTRRMIEASGASTLYEYLTQNSSLNVMPSSGNRYAPSIDMRGYGIGDGYQNIVVSLDGRRLNNIDLSTPLLGAIPLTDVERIEITKGSGSVLFGDGATAGSIQIYTRHHQGVSLEASAGNQGALAGTLTAGLVKDRFSLDFSAGHGHQDGAANADPSGHRDESSDQNWRGGIELRPVDGVKLKLDGSSSRIDTRYPSPLTLAQFQADPAQVGSNLWVTPVDAYSEQRLASDLWRLGADIALGSEWTLTASHNQEDKRSDFVSYNFAFDYGYQSDDLGLRYRSGPLGLAFGAQRFDGSRTGGGDRTRKNNSGTYFQGQYALGALTLSAGARSERVEYRYTPAGGTEIASNHQLASWDLGLNWRLDDHLSLFGNFDRAFQAPDVDRFLTTDFSVSPPVTSFNGFIVPAISRTLNLGLNHVVGHNRLKLTVFQSNLDHEIYYYPTSPWSGYNTNLDKTHKYGLELQDTWHATSTLTASVNYAYTRALIDQENDGGGAFNGKNLPGVPRHGVSLGLGWQVTPATHFQLAQVWRSHAYMAEDFSNSGAQRQAIYQSTDLALNLRTNKLEWKASVENLFAHHNGLWVADDVIYPVNYSRVWRLGVKADF